MTAIRSSIILSALMALGISSAAAEYKIATVDMNRIINEAPESKEAKQTLDKEFAAAKKKIEDKRDGLKATEAKIKDGSIKEDSKEAEKYRESAREFARLVKDTEDDLKKKFLKSNRALTEKAAKLVKAFAEKNNYALIFDKSDKARGPVLFAQPTSDVTEEVIKSMNS